MKKVLIITYHFPPDAAIGAVRPAEFVKFFPDYDWEPTILTVKEKFYTETDSERYVELQSKSVSRTTIIPTINELYLKIKKKFLKDELKPNSASHQDWFSESSSKKLFRFNVKYTLRRYYNSLIYLPDNFQGWLPFAFIKGLCIYRAARFDALFTTGPPQTTHLIGLLLKIVLGKQWIVDFRDPWTIKNKPSRSRSLFSDWIDCWMERMVVKHGDWIVSVTPQMTKRLQKLYPACQDKCITIFNGYDSKALVKYSFLEKYNKFTISYVGSLYFGRDPSIFLQAIAELLEEGQITANNFQVKLIGDCRFSDGKSVEKIVENWGLSEIVIFRDKILQTEAMGEIAKSHVALLIASRQPLQIPAKIFEYIGLRVSILGITGPGATRDLLLDYPCAYTVEPEDLNGMKKSIIKLFNNQFKDKLSKLDNSFFEKFERRNQVRQISDLLASPTP